MKDSSVTMGALLSSRIQSPSKGAEFLEVLRTSAMQFQPDFVGDEEPLIEKFDPVTALRYWGRSFLWRRRKPRVAGGVYMGFPTAHDVVRIDVPLSAISTDTVLDLMRSLDHAFGIEFGYAHVWRDDDMRHAEHYEARIAPLATLSTHDLRRGLPDLPWLSIFGPTYQQFFGDRDRILAAPASQAVSLGAAVALLLAPEPTDACLDQRHFDSRRVAVQRSLRRDGFRGEDASPAVPLLEVP